MRYPKFLQEGDTIGIFAPSAGIGYKADSFDKSLDVLRDAGFQIYETESVRNDVMPSAPAIVRGVEFNSLSSDDGISMIMAAAGGEYCMEMLPYIDADEVLSHPKWLAGYSDPTAIEMYLTTVLDIATIYGVNAGAWDRQPLHGFQLDALSLIRGDIPLQHSYDMWCSSEPDDDFGAYGPDTPVEWILLRGNGAGNNLDEAPDLHEEYVLDVTGRLIGGCIDVINWVFGSPYEDLCGFSERYAEDGLIWFFDNFEMNPMQLMYAMERMKQTGLFDHAEAVVFGRTCFPGEASDIDYLMQLERVFGDLDVPLIWNADIGHTKPSFTLINGAVGHLTFDHGDASLSIELK